MFEYMIGRLLKGVTCILPPIFAGMIHLTLLDLSLSKFIYLKLNLNNLVKFMPLPPEQSIPTLAFTIESSLINSMLQSFPRVQNVFTI